MPAIAPGQILIWDSFDETTLAAAGTGMSVSVEVPAGERRTLIASNFAPVDLSEDNTAATVTFTFSVSGGLAGVPGGTRPFGAGLFNSGAAAGFADDAGYFFWYNGTTEVPSRELRRRRSTGTSTSLLAPSGDSFANMGTGNVGTQSGSFADATVYTVTLNLVANGSGNIGFGLSNDPGVGITGASLSLGRYTNGETTEVTTFDTFGVMFQNTSGAASTLTIHSIDLAPIAEPGTLALVVSLAALGAVVIRRRKRS